MPQVEPSDHLVRKLDTVGVQLPQAPFEVCSVLLDGLASASSRVHEEGPKVRRQLGDGVVLEDGVKSGQQHHVPLVETRSAIARSSQASQARPVEAAMRLKAVSVDLPANDTFLSNIWTLFLYSL